MSNPPRVLLVEDEALIALDTKDALEDAGYSVSVADRIAQALALLDAETFDVAVLDVNVAGELIWPVAERLSKLRTPFILMTGLLATSPLPAFCEGAPRLSKPIHYAECLDAVAKVLGGAAPRREGATR